MLPVEIIPPAEAELRDAARYLEENRSTTIKIDFLRRFAKARRDIQQFPQMWTPSLEGTRCKRLGRFPYSIFYLLEETRIVIIAVAHQKRSPDYWKDRLTSPPPPQT